jgi:hypothetical protein
MSTPRPSPLVEAAGIYGAGVVARRGTLRSLYYDALANRQDSEALAIRQQAGYDGPNIRPGCHAAERRLTELRTTALAASQDSANALMLLIDSSLRRFAENEKTKVKWWWKDVGDHFNGVKLNKAVWALANHARHLHTWRTHRDNPSCEQQRSMDVIRELGMDPFHDHVACVYLVNLHCHPIRLSRTASYRQLTSWSTPRAGNYGSGAPVCRSSRQSQPPVSRIVSRRLRCRTPIK